VGKKKKKKRVGFNGVLKKPHTEVVPLSINHTPKKEKTPFNSPELSH
jgi:hypothetical protein